MKNIFISVIIPTYNTSQYIEECIDSFECQNYFNYEIIVCDDGSTDNTIEILERLKAKYKNITTIYNQHIGCGAARNSGLKVAKGKYIYFCDSDDYVSSNFFYEINNKISKNDYDIVFFNYNEVVQGEVINTVKREKIVSKYDCFKGNSCIWSSVYKKSLFTNNDTLFPIDIYHQDDAVFFRLIDFSDKITSIDKELYNYRKFREGSSMNTRSEKYYTDILEATKINFKYFFNKNDRCGCDELVDVYVGKLFDYLLFNLAYSSKKTTKKYYLNMMNILNDCVSNWKNNEYFHDSQVSKITIITRRSLKNKMIFLILNTKSFKALLKKKMENYQ